jgi:WD40 repeat protein
LTPDGRRLDRHGAGRIVRRIARRAGISKAVSPHTLRHAFITTALDARVLLRDMQKAASHADPRTTMRYDRARVRRLFARFRSHRNLSFAVSADGRRAVSGGYDRSVRVWDLAQRAELACFVSDSEIRALAATSPAMRVIGGTSTGPVHFLELRACN